MEMNANNVLLLQIIMHIFPMIVSSLIKRNELYEDTYINTIYLGSYYAIIVLDIQLRCIASKYIWIFIVLMLYIYLFVS